MDANEEFQIIEPPIYDELNWDMEIIMKALEYLRQVLPTYLTDLPKNSKYFLFVFRDFFSKSHEMTNFCYCYVASL